MKKVLLLTYACIVVSFMSCRNDEINSQKIDSLPLPTTVNSLSEIDIRASGFNYQEAPENCDPQFVATQISGLAEAINQSDLEKTLSYFSFDSKYPFAFTSNETLGSNSDNQIAFRQNDLEQLTEFLEVRFLQNERLVFTEIEVNFFREDFGQTTIHFGPVHGSRTADDFNDAKQLVLKGALYCETGTFAIFGF